MHSTIRVLKVSLFFFAISLAFGQKGEAASNLFIGKPVSAIESTGGKILSSSGLPEREEKHSSSFSWSLYHVKVGKQDLVLLAKWTNGHDEVFVDQIDIKVNDQQVITFPDQTLFCICNDADVVIYPRRTPFRPGKVEASYAWKVNKNTSKLIRISSKVTCELDSD